MKLTKEQIIKKLLKDLDIEMKEIYSKEENQTVNDERWTLADLFIRQWLNNGSNGFGMKRVKANYEWLKTIKSELIKYNLISKDGFNNSGFPLWENYNFGRI
jgi:hypothetical protein